MLQIIKQIADYLKFQDINEIDKLPRNSNFHYSYLLGIAICYMMLMILSGLLIYKIVKIGYFVGPASICVAPLTYCLSNVVTEVYGYAVARNMMWWFIISSAIFTLSTSLLIYLPSPPTFQHQDAFNLIFGSMPRIFLAGTIGTIIGLSFDNYIVSKLKILMHGRKYWFRSAISTSGGEIVYNFIAYPIMYLGIVNTHEFIHIFLSVTVFKVMMTMIFLTPECFLARYLKIKEKINVYDYNVNYNIFKIKFSEDKPLLKIVN
jgi:queuosine precursor transporter